MEIILPGFVFIKNSSFFFLFLAADFTSIRSFSLSLSPSLSEYDRVILFIALSNISRTFSSLSQTFLHFVLVLSATPDLSRLHSTKHPTRHVSKMHFQRSPLQIIDIVIRIKSTAKIGRAQPSHSFRLLPSRVELNTSFTAHFYLGSFSFFDSKFLGKSRRKSNFIFIHLEVLSLAAFDKPNKKQRAFQTHSWHFLSYSKVLCHHFRSFVSSKSVIIIVLLVVWRVLHSSVIPPPERLYSADHLGPIFSLYLCIAFC